MNIGNSVGSLLRSYSRVCGARAGPRKLIIDIPKQREHPEPRPLARGQLCHAHVWSSRAQEIHRATCRLRRGGRASTFRTEVTVKEWSFFSGERKKSHHRLPHGAAAALSEDGSLARSLPRPGPCELSSRRAGRPLIEIRSILPWQSQRTEAAGGRKKRAGGEK